MKRAIFEIKGIDIHVRKMGSGYPLVLFHDSPRSSRMMLELAEELKDYFTLIMPDTPGSGLSDVVPHTPHTMAALIPYFKDLFLKMGLKKFGLYGIGTGAQSLPTPWVDWNPRAPSSVRVLVRRRSW